MTLLSLIINLYMLDKYYKTYKKFNYKLILINANFIFKKPSFLILSSLLKDIQMDLLKVKLYLALLNQIFFAMLDYFLDFVTFINILSGFSKLAKSFTQSYQEKCFL